MTDLLSKKSIKEIKIQAYYNKEIVEIDLSKIKTKFIVFIFYPGDFTTVCPTELIKFSSLKDEFKELDTTVMFVSTDSPHCHRAWCEAPVENSGIGAMNWPMLSDIKHELSNLFHVFNDSTCLCARATVTYSVETSSVKNVSINDNSVGRSTKEVLRFIKALDFAEKNSGFCFVDYEIETD